MLTKSLQGIQMVKIIRKKLGLTQAQLGKKLNVSRQMIFLYETKKRHMSIATAKLLITLASKQGIKCSLDDIFAEKNKSA